MTPAQAVTMLMLYVALIGFSLGLTTARLALWIGRWLERRRLERALARNRAAFGFEPAKGDDMTAWRIWHGGARPGKATNAAIAERDAYRAEVALMARDDAHPAARSIAAKLTARVQMRMAGGNGHG